MTLTYISRGFSAAGGAIQLCVDESTQLVGNGLLQLTKVMDPDILQRICKATALGIAAMADAGCVPSALKNFKLESFKIVLLNTDAGHNFWSWFRQPYNWFKPITVNLVDWDAAQNELIAKLNAQLSRSGAPNHLTQAEVDKFATDCMNKQLEHMKKGVNYATPEEFKKDLAKQLKVVNGDSAAAHHQPAFANVDLADFTLPHRNANYLEWWTNFSFTWVDALCVPLYLKIWNLDPCPFLLGKAGDLTLKAADAVSLGTQARGLGETRLFKWVSSQDLGNVVWGACTAAFLFQFLEARRKLNDQSLKSWQMENAKRDAIAAAAEAIYCGANFLTLQNSNSILVNSLGVVAKLAGVWRILSRNDHPKLKSTTAVGG